MIRLYFAPVSEVLFTKPDLRSPRLRRCVTSRALGFVAGHSLLRGGRGFPFSGVRTDGPANSCSSATVCNQSPNASGDHFRSCTNRLKNSGLAIARVTMDARLHVLPPTFSII